MNKAMLAALFFLCVFAMPARAGETAAGTTGAVAASEELFRLTLEEIREKYGDGQLTVKGIAAEVGPDIFGLPSVTLSDAPDGTAHVLCVLPYSDYFKLGNIEKGKEITMSGSPRGKTNEGVVVLKQSVVVAQ